MAGVTTAPAADAAPRSARRAAPPSDAPSRGFAALATLASLAVAAAWGLTASAVMGSLGVARRAAMNSEWAFDTDRLPQPWVILVGAAAVVAAHAFFRWTMRRAGDPRSAFGAAVPALVGVLGGVLWGAFDWYRYQPPLQRGVKVGPTSGHSTPWGPLGYAAFYAFAWLPALAALAAAVAFFVGRRSPLRAYRAWRSRRRAARRARAARPGTRTRAAAS